MAMACLRFFTLPPFPPLPERNVPFFRRRMALLTVFCEALPYLAMKTPPVKVDENSARR
jgi:hypothetical protein